MQSRMLGSSEDSKVSRVIVEPVAIDMVNIFVRRELPRPLLFNDMPVFSDLAAVDADVAIPVLEPALADASSVVALDVSPLDAPRRRVCCFPVPTGAETIV